MKPYFQDDWNIVYNGEAMEILKTLPDESVNCVITSPPYWALRDYGTGKWIGGDDKSCSHKRDSKHSELCNTGQRNLEGAIGDGIYRDICKRCGAKRIDKQLGLEKTFQEYVTRLCNIFDQVKRVLRPDGTVWVVIGDTYGGSGNASGEQSHKNCGRDWSTYGASQGNQQSTKGLEKSLCQVPSRFAIEMCNRGWILRNKIIWYKQNCMPSSVKDRFTVDYEEILFFVKNKKYWFEQQYETSIDPESFEGRRKRNPSLMIVTDKKHYAKAGSFDMNGNDRNIGKTYPKRNKRTVWQVNSKPYSEAHFAVYPPELIEPCIRAGCPEKGVVLDPFAGSGTTGTVAKLYKRKSILIELNSEYCKLILDRIRSAVPGESIESFSKTHVPKKGLF